MVFSQRYRNLSSSHKSNKRFISISFSTINKTLLNRQFFCLICAVFFLIVVFSPLHVPAEQFGAIEIIEQFNAALLESMKKGDELGFSARYNVLNPVIQNSFALSFMAKKSIGRYRKTLSPEEIKLLTDVYTEWTIATYAGRFDSYSGETFKLLSEEKSERETLTVISRLSKKSGDYIDFHYKLRKSGNKWYIVDIHISGISQLALTRSQFVSVLKKDGFDELITRLKEKIDEFSGGKD